MRGSLGEDSQEKVGVDVGVCREWNDSVVAWRQMMSAACFNHHITGHS